MKKEADEELYKTREQRSRLTPLSGKIREARERGDHVAVKKFQDQFRQVSSDYSPGPLDIGEANELSIKCIPTKLRKTNAGIKAWRTFQAWHLLAGPEKDHIRARLQEKKSFTEWPLAGSFIEWALDEMARALDTTDATFFRKLAVALEADHPTIDQLLVDYRYSACRRMFPDAMTLMKAFDPGRHATLMRLLNGDAKDKEKAKNMKRNWRKRLDELKIRPRAPMNTGLPAKK